MTRLEFIELRNLNFHYIKERKIIKNINAKIYKNEITAITGLNGSGKTTLGKLIMGILKPISGEVFIFNENISNITLGQVGMRIGYLFQNPEKQFFSHTVEDEIGFILKTKGFEQEYIDDKVDTLLKMFQLDHLRGAFPLRLSQGEKQRLAIAAILANDLEYLILDEPTTGLDMKRKEILTNVLKELYEKGIGMTIISHDYSFLDQLSNRIIKIHRGEIVEDKRTEN